MGSTSSMMAHPEEDRGEGGDRTGDKILLECREKDLHRAILAACVTTVTSSAHLIVVLHDPAEPLNIRQTHALEAPTMGQVLLLKWVLVVPLRQSRDEAVRGLGYCTYTLLYSILSYPILFYSILLYSSKEDVQQIKQINRTVP